MAMPLTISGDCGEPWTPANDILLKYNKVLCRTYVDSPCARRSTSQCCYIHDNNVAFGTVIIDLKPIMVVTGGPTVRTMLMHPMSILSLSPLVCCLVVLQISSYARLSGSLPLHSSARASSFSSMQSTVKSYQATSTHMVLRNKTVL